MTYGMTPQGFIPKRLSDILSDITTKTQAIEDPNTGLKPFINESADSLFGQFGQIIAEELAICWEQAYLASQQFDPLNVSGVPLRGLVQLDGIRPSFGSYTEISMTLTGTDGTVIPKGSLIATSDGKYTFATVANASIASGTATVNAVCQTKGPIDPAVNTVITIQTPVFGWTNATNTATVSLGADAETDTQLHLRQQRATAATSYRQVDAILAGIMNVPGVKFARVYVNNTTTTDAQGITGKTIAPVVVGGTNEDVAEAIRLKCGTLDNSQGTTSVTFVGDLGDTQVISFYRPTAVPIYISIDISTTENSQFPIDGIDLIKQAIVDYAEYDQSGANGFPPGADVVLSRLYTPINSVPGFKVNTLEIGTDPNTLAASDVTIDWNEIAAFSVDNITITVS